MILIQRIIHPWVLLVLVALVLQDAVHAQERNITIPTPTVQADIPNSITRAINGSSLASASLNVTATGSRNITSANSTRTSSLPDPTKPFATDFQTQTYRVPAPAAPGGGEVAQSPDDSYIAGAERALAFGLVSVTVALVGAAVVGLV